MKLDYPVDLLLYCEDYDFDGFKISLSDKDYEACHEIACIVVGEILEDDLSL